MKEKVNIKSLIPILGLILLLSLSSCKVRNFIQAELGLQKTIVTNKSKTTLSSYSCSGLAIYNSIITQKSTPSQNSLRVVADFEFTFYISDFSNNYLPVHATRKHLVSAIPLYILYQNFKDYL